MDVLAGVGEIPPLDVDEAVLVEIEQEVVLPEVGRRMKLAGCRGSRETPVEVVEIVRRQRARLGTESVQERFQVGTSAACHEGAAGDGALQK